MTLIYSNAGGFLGKATGSPIQCPRSITYCPDYAVDDCNNNVDTCSSKHSSSRSKTFISDRMKNNVNIRLSLEDVSNSVFGGELNSQRSASCVMGRNQRSDIDLPRSILKKAASADAASIARLRETLLATRRLSISLSDTNLTQHCFDDDDESTRPRSPSKNVTFADDNNLSLVKIHNFVPSNERLDQWQFASFCPTNFRISTVSGNAALVPVKGRIVRKPVELLLCFKEPCDNPDFSERFQHKCVALERCATRDRTITGIILVKNIEYEKHVSVRYTVDRWKTTADVEACYLPNSNDGKTDRFSFTLSLPKTYKEMEFAVSFKTGSAEYWDNNYNRNYKVKDALSPY